MLGESLITWLLCIMYNDIRCYCKLIFLKELREHEKIIEMLNQQFVSGLKFLNSRYWTAIIK